MEWFKLRIRCIDGSLQAINALPSTKVSDLCKLIQAKLSDFHDVKLVLGNKVLSEESSLADEGVSAAVEIHIVKNFAIDRFIEALQDWKKDYPNPSLRACLFNFLEGNIHFLRDRNNYDLSAQMFTTIEWVALSVFHHCEEEYWKEFNCLCDSFGQICHDLDHWSEEVRSLCNRFDIGDSLWAKVNSTSRDHLMVQESLLRLAFAIDARRQDLAQNDDGGDGNSIPILGSKDENDQLMFDNESGNSRNRDVRDGKDTSLPSHQAETFSLSTNGADGLVLASLADADDKKDLLKAIEESEREALQQEQDDLFKTIVESKTSAGDGAQSAPSRLEHNCFSSSHCRRDLLDVDTASVITPELWDDVANIGEGAGDAYDESSSSLRPPAGKMQGVALPVMEKPPGIFHPSASHNGIGLISSQYNRAPCIENILIEIPEHGLAPRSEEQDNEERSHEVHNGSRKTRNRNRRKRNSVRKYKTLAQGD